MKIEIGGLVMPRVKSGFLLEFKAVKDAIERSRDKEAGRAYVKVKRYIERGGFSSVRYDGEFSILVMDGYDDDYIANKFGISVATVRGHRRRIGKALESILGEDFCQLFYHYQDNKEEIRKRTIGLEVNDVSTFDLLPRELIGSQDCRRQKLSFDLSDCRDELDFLEKHCLSIINSERSRLDVNKIAYLLDVIDGYCGSTSVRTEVLLRLMNKGDE